MYDTVSYIQTISAHSKMTTYTEQKWTHLI
jgi:hypothetical protein